MLTDEKIIAALSQDLSAGTEVFRDKLLNRCLNVFDQMDSPVELSDDQLDMLAAAGIPDPDNNPTFPPII